MNLRILALATAAAALLGGLGPGCSDDQGEGASGSVGACEPGAVRTCAYTGPQGTEGVGACKAGTQVCAADGAGYGECAAETLPALELCGTTVDESCDGDAACSGAHVWSKAFGALSYSFDHGIAVDGAGNVVVAASFSGTADLGGDPMTSTFGNDVFLAKLDPAGAPLWSKHFYDKTYAFAARAAVDGDGNVIFAAHAEGEIDLGGGPMQAQLVDVFVAKFDPAGALLWRKQFGDDGFQGIERITTDRAGNIILAGFTDGSIDFGGGLLQNGLPGKKFIAKLDPSGNHVWSKLYGGTGDNFFLGIATDSAGNLIVSYRYEYSCSFGGAPQETDHFHHAGCLAKIDPVGNHLWTKHTQSDVHASYGAIAVDRADNIVFASGYSGTTDLGFGPLPTTTQYVTDMVLAKLDPSGEHLWHKTFGAEGSEVLTGVALDGADDIVLVGGSDGTVSLGGAPIVGDSMHHKLVMAKLDASGEHIWSHGFTHHADDGVSDIRADSTGAVLLSGSFNTPLDFGGGPLQPADLGDGYIVKLGP